ncbi:hypothetical protein KST80_07725 [Fusobacterium polymorphum]|uniref:Uncharacterized protein n=1 Tax=Fusobacterium nucleatum subsp. polymorphum TaxID=76857 RepID=A0A1Z3CIG3_FUSNP|nr:hypothetical protein [Fusobacterium polymorphum]ASC03080.1 hypothetical protein CBG50_07060 [Fusobacterium polymorphum]PHI03801.1 hypothetical protein CBG54_12455 [Fusobacterium polymorphum]PHI16114.1 hypothetical protein CBG58_03240 [Fusobacterium polymorphum]
MKIKKNGFYLIKDEFFKKMNDSSLPLQKNGRPMYYCIEDKNNKNIFWVIPMTTKMDKVNRIITQEGGEDKCKIYVINSSEKNSAFNIQDIFPIKENYIEREYTKNGVHYLLKNKALIEKVEKRAKDIISSKMTKKEIGKNEINIRKIYKTLEKELILENSENQVKNYNCLTGELINIQNHSSGENKWIARKDIEKFRIEKKENAKEIIANIYLKMSEKELKEYIKNKGNEEVKNLSDEEKLYQIPITYYNISDLKITKEIEQKFVPMKEKKKSQEIENSKGQGIGD